MSKLVHRTSVHRATMETVLDTMRRVRHSI
jgi:hypothetical protein